MMADEHLGHFPCLGTHKLNSTEKLCQHHFANGSIDQVQDYFIVVFHNKHQIYSLTHTAGMILISCIKYIFLKPQLWLGNNMYQDYKAVHESTVL